MTEQIYDWIQNITVYLIVMSAVMHVIPGREYVKYVRFFSGIVLILLLFGPVLKIMGMEQTFMDIYTSQEYELEKQEIESASNMYEKYGFSGEPSTESGGIEVEEIIIGD